MRGKKKLQKIVYIAQRLGYPFGQGFVWYDYGPYSPTLALEMQELEENGLVRAVATRRGEYPTTSYKLLSRGKEYLELFGSDDVPASSFDQLAKQLHELRSGYNLELVASIMYWEVYGLSRNESIKRVLKEKPQYEGNRKALLQAIADLEAIATYAVE